MSDDGSVQTSAITSDEQIRNVMRRLIQKAYDRRDFTRASLAKESGVNVFQIDAIVSHDKGKQRRVTCEDAFCIAYTLGEDAVAALIGTITYTARKIDGDDVNASQIVASILPHVSTIAIAAADGRFDHIERPACTDAADHIIATMLPLSSAGGR